jgi:hypothetical protein
MVLPWRLTGRQRSLVCTTFMRFLFYTLFYPPIKNTHHVWYCKRVDVLSITDSAQFVEFSGICAFYVRFGHKFRDDQATKNRAQVIKDFHMDLSWFILTEERDRMMAEADVVPLGDTSIYPSCRPLDMVSLLLSAAPTPQHQTPTVMRNIHLLWLKGKHFRFFS